VSDVGPMLFTLLVAAGEADAPATQAMIEALREAVGGEIVASVRETPGPLSDDELLELERASGSGAVATVNWAGDLRLQARVRLHLRASGRWVERDLGFATTDDPRERGRTLGFTLASMLPDRGVAPARPRAPVLVETAPVAPPGRLALDALVLGSLGVNGNADGLGGGFAVRYSLWPSLALRAELAGRTGVVQAAQATSISARVAAGLAWSPFGDVPTRRANLGIRSDLAMFYESLGHLSSDDLDRDRRGRFLPGADLVVEGSLRVLGQAAVVLGVGAELAFGHTDVYVHQRKVAVVPPLRLVTSVGLRHYF
jgi:hypothetical protein